MSNKDSEAIYRNMFGENSSTYMPRDPHPHLEMAQHWHPVHGQHSQSATHPVIVEQYVEGRESQFPLVIIFNVSHGIDDAPGKAPDDCFSTGNDDNPYTRSNIFSPDIHWNMKKNYAHKDELGIYRSGIVERHIDIPAWMVPYIELINNEHSLSMYNPKEHRTLGSHKPREYPGTCWTRARLLQTLFVHGTVMYNLDRIDYFSLRDKGPTDSRMRSDDRTEGITDLDHLNAQRIPLEVTWNDETMHKIWQGLERAILNSDVMGDAESAFGQYNLWPSHRHKIGLDRVFYEVDMTDENTPEIIKKYMERHAPEGKHHQKINGKWTQLDPVKVVEHTYRTEYGYDITLGHRQASGPIYGGSAKTHKDRESYDQIDKLVHSCIAMLEHEGWVKDKIKKGFSLALGGIPSKKI